jgi:hypothetical protein
MMKKRYLTKSRFITAIDCPTKLFYIGKKEYKNKNNEDSFLASLAEGGYQVGSLAKFLFKDGIEVLERDHETSAKVTEDLLKKDNVVIYEAAIKFNNFFIRIDILEKKGNQLKIYEAKAKSYNSLLPDMEGARGGIKAGYLSYLQDIAFQTWVIQQTFPKFEISSFLVMPNKANTAEIDGLNQMFKITQDNKVILRIPDDVDIYSQAQKILAKVAVDSLVSRIINEPLLYPGNQDVFAHAAIKWAEAYANDIKIPAVLGKHCKSCEFKSEIGSEFKSGFHECWKETLNWSDKDFEDSLVLDLYNSKRKDEYIENQKYKIKQLNRDDFKEFDEEAGVEGLSSTQRQWLQVNGIPKDYDHGGFYFDKSFYLVKKSEWKYPYHLIDFETTKTALPFYKNMRPYQSIGFQFSHHILNANGFLEHADEFICVEPGEFPSYKFVRALRKALSNDNGTIFRWSHHENTILNGICEELNSDSKPPEDKDELIEFIKAITKGGDREMVDLCAISSKCFFHEYTNGRNSLKVVLPALFMASPFLRDTYSKPIYGSPNGIPSFNFKSNAGFSWFDPSSSNYDPYVILKSLAYDLLPEDIEDIDDDQTSIISEGGAAAMAYARLQFEDLNKEARLRITDSLLRYCELDTLAMAMVVQAWDHI